eukprot:5981177-Prymnesium_polylepis.1
MCIRDRCGPADVASSRETCSEKPASASVGAGCEVANLPRVEQVPVCMLCARDAPDLRYRGIEGQICGIGRSAATAVYWSERREGHR